MLYIFLMLVAGGMIAMQSPINAALGRTIGVLESGLFNFLVGSAFLVLVVLFFGRGNILQVTNTPPWQWIGGILGATLVLSTIVCVPRIGALSTIVAMIVGNLLLGALIDHFGWFGLPVIPFSLQRLAGFAAIALGLFLVMKH